MLNSSNQLILGISSYVKYEFLELKIAIYFILNNNNVQRISQRLRRYKLIEKKNRCQSYSKKNVKIIIR